MNITEYINQLSKNLEENNESNDLQSIIHNLSNTIVNFRQNFGDKYDKIIYEKLSKINIDNIKSNYIELLTLEFDLSKINKRYMNMIIFYVNMSDFLKNDYREEIKNISNSQYEDLNIAIKNLYEEIRNKCKEELF